MPNSRFRPAALVRAGTQKRNHAAGQHEVDEVVEMTFQRRRVGAALLGYSIVTNRNAGDMIAEQSFVDYG